MSLKADEIDAVVRSSFVVKDSYQLPEGEMEYKVEYGRDSKASFFELNRALAPQGLAPWLTGTKEECALTLRKRTPASRRRSRIPVLLALLTLASVVFFSLFERIVYEQFAPGIPGYVLLVSYWMTLVLVLGVHEVARYFVAKRASTPLPNSFLVPGVPYLTSFLPSLGFVSYQSQAIVNRERFFDIMFSGPLMTLFASVIAYSIGGLVSAQSSQPISACQQVGTYISTCPSVLQSGLDLITAPFMQPIAHGFQRFSPLQDGATIGFLLAFLGLLPAASLDGGYLASLASGPKVARALTYVSVFLLIVIDTPSYWGIAVVVLLLAGRPVKIQVLDEVSGLSNTKRLVYAVAVVLAFLLIPAPQNLASLHLG